MMTGWQKFILSLSLFSTSSLMCGGHTAIFPKIRVEHHEVNGREVHGICSFVELTEQLRQVATCVSDQLFRKNLQRNRLGRCADEVTVLNKHHITSSIDSLGLAPKRSLLLPLVRFVDRTAVLH